MEQDRGLGTTKRDRVLGCLFSLSLPNYQIYQITKKLKCGFHLRILFHIGGKCNETLTTKKCFSKEKRQRRRGYRGELDVDGVVEGQLLLQILQLLRVLAAGRLPHVVHVEHAGVPAVRHDHSPQIWKSDGGRR